GRAFGFHRAADGLGSVIGAILAFSLLSFMDYEDIFLFAFIPGIIAVFVILFIKESNSTCVTDPAPISIKVSMKALPWNLRLFIIVSSVFALGHFGYAFLLLKAKDIGLADHRAILLYVFFYVIYTICSIPSGTLSDKIGRKPVLIIGYSIFAITSFGLIFTSSTYVLLMFFGTYGIFFAMIDGAQRAFAVDLAPPHLKATALGTFHTAIGLVALPGGFIAGLLWDNINPETTFIYGLVLTIASIALFTFVRPENQGA
ncbi:MAG: MFS transporter, partial [Planctomycetes bacterium]|nr:MFS transporter [Planctomycetota bacterium]